MDANLNTRAYDEQLSPLGLDDLSETGGILLPKKMEPSCLAIHGDKIYVGTKNSRVFVYTFNSETFVDEEKIVANYKIISSITVSPLYYVLTP